MGIVVTDRPDLSLYKIAVVKDDYKQNKLVCWHTFGNNNNNLLVFPEASSPSMRTRISLLPNIFDKSLPILVYLDDEQGE